MSNAVVHISVFVFIDSLSEKEHLLYVQQNVTHFGSCAGPLIFCVRKYG